MSNKRNKSKPLFIKRKNTLFLHKLKILQLIIYKCIKKDLQRVILQLGVLHVTVGELYVAHEYASDAPEGAVISIHIFCLLVIDKIMI